MDDDDPVVSFMFDAAAPFDVREYEWKGHSVKYASLVQNDTDTALQSGHTLWRGALLALEALEPASSVLELGCGCGLCGLALAVAGSERVYLTDRDPGALKLARTGAEANCLNVVETKMLRFGQLWTEDKVELVVASDVIYDVGLAALILRTAASALTPDGMLCIAASFAIDEAELMRALDSNGLRIVALLRREGGATIWLARPLSVQATVATLEAFELIPKAFLPTWNGALALAFSGWPASVIDMKSRLLSSCPENPGSKWPKVTLGALTRPLNLTAFSLLDKTLRLASQHLQEFTWSVSTLYITCYACGSHERILAANRLTLRPSTEDCHPPSDIELAKVDALLAERDDTHAYLPRFNGDGTDHSLRYTRDKGGTSLVAFFDHPPFIQRIRQLRAEVDACLGPGAVRWFHDYALHCTLRALVV